MFLKSYQHKDVDNKTTPSPTNLALALVNATTPTSYNISQLIKPAKEKVQQILVCNQMCMLVGCLLPPMLLMAAIFFQLIMWPVQIVLFNNNNANSHKHTHTHTQMCCSFSLPMPTTIFSFVRKIKKFQNKYQMITLKTNYSVLWSLIQESLSFSSRGVLNKFSSILKDFRLGQYANIIFSRESL